jgi:hypothetical protein
LLLYQPGKRLFSSEDISIEGCTLIDRAAIRRSYLSSPGLLNCLFHVTFTVTEARRSCVAIAWKDDHSTTALVDPGMA